MEKIKTLYLSNVPQIDLILLSPEGDQKYSTTTTIVLASEEVLKDVNSLDALMERLGLCLTLPTNLFFNYFKNGEDVVIKDDQSRKYKIVQPNRSIERELIHADIFVPRAKGIVKRGTISDPTYDFKKHQN